VSFVMALCLVVRLKKYTRSLPSIPLCTANMNGWLGRGMGRTLMGSLASPSPAALVAVTMMVCTRLLLRSDKTMGDIRPQPSTLP